MKSDEAGSADDEGVAATIPHDPLRHPGLPSMFEGERFEVLATESEVETDGLDEDLTEDDDLECVDMSCWRVLCCSVVVS